MKAARHIGMTMFHPVGPCGRGRTADPLTVVDRNLRVKGMRGLRVVDAFVMSFISSDQTNAPTPMIAGKMSRLIIAKMHQRIGTDDG